MAANQIGLNQIFPIYNEDGTSFHDLVLRKGVVDSIVMSLGDKITGDVFYKDNTLQVTMKEYVEYNGIHFSLVNPPTIVREGMVSDNGELKGMTKYSFVFYHPMYQLSNFPFTDVATKTGEEKYLSQNKSFSWIGKPQDYIDKLNKNLQGTVWYVRKSDRFPVEKDDELSEVQQFDNVSVAEAIKRGYEIWDIPYIVSQLPSNDPLYAQGKRFVVEYGLPSNEIYENESARQLDTPFVFQMGQGVGLKNNSRTPRNNKIVTRIAGYGSEDNVPYGYPQIVWTGNQNWDYTINNDPNNPLSYPIYKGIVGGQYVKLIKHPFTRTHLMPSIFTDTVNKKVNPRATGYDPTIEIKDYYDAIATQEYPYTNEINPQAPSYESHEFADIKPELDADRTTGIVSAVPLNADLTPADHWDDSMDDDGNYLQSYFQITLPQLTFDLYACAAITQEMQINMRSGACIGCTFPVQVDWEDYKRNFYDEDGNFVPDGEQRDLTKYPKSNLGQISVVVQKDNSTFGTLMPNIYQQPKADDLFVFIGISLPLSYIANAEERLDDAMKTYMLENNVFYFDYPLKFDEHFLATHTYILEQIRPNSIIHFDYGGVEQQLFVKQLTIKYENAPLPQYDITLTDNIEVVLNQIGQVADDVEKMSSLIAILRQSYSRNVWNELAKKLSKVDDDTAKGWITILKGVRTLSDFIELSEGGAFYTDENTLAHLTADVARIRERILGTLRVGDTTASVQTEPTLHVGGDARIDDSLEVHEDLNVGHDAVIGEILTALNHIYTNLLTSDNFTDDSAFGTGFSLSKKKNNENRSYLVVDELFVRWKAIFNELEIRRISYTGGNRVSSHAASKIVKVKDIVKKLSYTVAGTVLTLSGQVNVIGQTLNIDGGVTVNGTTATLTTNSVTYAKRCYAMKDDGTTATMNWWRVNDQARCQTFNIQEGVYQNVSNKSYWRRVLAVGSENIEIDGALSEKPYDYVDLSVADCMTGSDLPEAGDTIVQMGNRTDTSRQGFIVSEVAGESAPDIQIFRNVNSYTLEGKRKIILSPDDTHLRVNSLVIETEYDAQRVPMERGDWDAIPEHKCYYYDLVQYNGATWLCIFPESGTGGVKYTTEPPSESSIYWQIYAQKGADGKDGKDGKSFNILGSYDTEEELIEAHPTGQVGDAYIVAGYLYVWDEEKEEWHNSGQIKGDTGRGISSVTISYGKSNSSTTIPSTWYSSVDAVGLQAGDYLFTRMVYNYTDGEPAQSEPVYSIGYIGRDGSSPVVGDIDNEVISVACDKDGKVLAEFNKTISVKIYNGSTPVTLKDNGLTVSSASGITIDQVSAANGTFRVHIPQNNTIAQANNFTVTATANIGGTDVPKVMSFVVNGVRQGSDGTPATIYELLTSLSSIKKDKDGTPDVNTITATKQKTVGNVTSETTDGTLKYKIDGGNEQTYSSAIQTSSISTGIEFIYYIGNVIVDRETIPVIMDGQDGADGTSVTITSKSVKYAVTNNGTQPADSSFTYNAIPSSLELGQYLWTKTEVVYSDGNSTKAYSVSRLGTDGEDGQTGADGYTTHFAYATSADGSQGFSTTNFNGATYIGTYRDQNATDSTNYRDYTWTEWKGEKGDKGDDGRGISGVNTYYYASASTPSRPSGNPSQSGWVDDGNSLITSANANKHLYECTCTTYSDGTYSWTTPVDDGIISDMAATSEEFALSDSGTTAPTSNWSSSVTPTVGKWIWSRTKLTFRSGNPSYVNTQCVGYCGTNGDSITKASADTYRYAIGDSGITPPSSGWSNAKPSTFEKNKWLWTETTIHWSDNSTTVLYSAERNPNDGAAGQDIVAGTTVITYCVKDSNSQQPADSDFKPYSQIVSQIVPGKWLWSKSTTPYYKANDQQAGHEIGFSSNYSVSYIAKDGDSITKKSEVKAYQASDNGTTVPTGQWQDEAHKPTPAQNQYLWTRTTITWSDDSTTTLYSAERNPLDGDSISISSQSVTYSKKTAGNINPTTITDWGAYPTSLAKGDWLYSKTTVVYSDNNSTTSYAVSYIGNDGTSVIAQYSVNGTSNWHNTYAATDKYMRTSADGGSTWGSAIKIVGEDGENGDYIDSSFAISAHLTASGKPDDTPAANSWSDEPVATTAQKPYLWCQQVSHTFNGGTETVGNPKYFRMTGEEGQKGADGRALTSMTEYYKATNSNSPMSKPSSASGWDDDPNLSDLTDKWDANHIYLWNMEQMVYTESDGTTTTDYTIPKILAIWTKNGDAGRGIDSIVNHYMISNSLTPPEKTDSGWRDTPVPPTASNPFLWNYETITWVNPSSTTDTDVVMIGHFGKDGISVRAQYSANGTSWHDTFASTDKWMRTSTDNGTTWSTAMKIVGENGAETDFSFGISQYKTSADAQTAPSDISTWSDAPIAVTEQKPYLWSKVVQKNGSGTVIDTSYIRLTGEDGTSVTIDTSNTFTKYQKGDSGTTIPTGTWQPTIPPVEQGKYLWTWVHTAYSDGSYTDVYTPTYQSNDGTDSLPLAYLNLSDSVVDIEVDENGKATKDFYEEITYTMGAYGKFLYIKSVSVSSSSHVSIPSYMLSPLANGLITVNGTTATLTKSGVTVQGTTATLPYGYTAIPKIEVKAQDGDTINEGTVTVNGVAVDTDGNEYTAMSIFKNARQYKIEALQLVLSQDTMILTQDDSGDIILTDAYTDLALRIGGTDITTDLSIATEVSQFYDEEDERYINSCNVSVVGNRVRITDIGSYSYIPSGSTDEKIVYCESGYVDITVTYRGVPYTKRWQFYCNLLGTWKSEVENDTQKIVAQRISYVVNDGDPTKTIEQTKNTFTQMSSSVEQVSEWKEEKENVYDGYDQRITNTNTRVSDAEGNISRVQRTVQNGNDNLVMNGAFISDTLNWSEWGEPSIREIVSVDGCKWMHIVTTSERFQGYRQIHFSDFGITIKGGEKYTLSLRAFCASGTSKICVGFHWRSSALSENILADWFPFDIDTEKKQYKVTFTVPETGTYEGQSYDIDHFNIMVGSNYEMQGVEGRNFYITDIKLEQGEIVTSWSDNVHDSYSQIKQTSDQITAEVNTKASTGYVDITASNVIAKINETGIDIENKKITMTAEQTLFKDLAGREMISFEMVNYNGESLPSLVFWDSRGKKNGEKAWVLNWRGLIDMMQNTVNPSFAEYDGMYGSIRTGGDSFTEGSKWYAETIWWLNQAHGGVRPSIDMVSKYLYSMGYTKQGSQVNPFPVGSENCDGKLYNSDDWDSVHLPTGTLVSGWYITSVTPYAQGDETYRKMFTFSHYDGGVQNATFVVCIDALYVYDIHGQIVSTYYQIYGTMTDSSVQTGSDMGGEYMIIPTVNNSNNS